MKKFTSAVFACVLCAVLCASAGVFPAGAASARAASSALVGDANGDGTVSIKDATLIQMHLAGIAVLDDSAAQLADTNGNGRVDIDDVTCIQKYAARLIDGFETAQPDTAAQTTQSQTTQAQTTEAAAGYDSDGYNNIVVKP